jgi:Zn-dependent peptidase ImmA (M78 family)
LFRQVRGLRETRQCDLEGIAAEDGLELIEFDDAEPGCTACLFPAPSGSGGAIFLQPGQSEGRCRFSIGHELAHYHIPTHKRRRWECGDHDLQATEDFRHAVEWEANGFAAELLMPEVLFRQDARRGDVSFANVYELASGDSYNVSVTAAAIRLVETSRECCALVATEAGQVIWQVRSDFYYRMATRGQTIRSDTYAAAVQTGEQPNARPEPVDPLAWFDDPAHSRVELLESTHAIPRLRQVVALLWVPEPE